MDASAGTNYRSTSNAGAAAADPAYSLFNPHLWQVSISSWFTGKQPLQVEAGQVSALERVMLVEEIDPSFRYGLESTDRKRGIATPPSINQSLDGPGSSSIKTRPHCDPLTMRGISIKIAEDQDITLL